ncbi:peptidoglycan/LPS O-acetylase OafA/YrhL [Paraburkholderia sp. BL8N3]|nr:acyltransferase [Paraburkholderia sp. BL8N3]TCK39624.1 peptidoglycan/LPS O-acetylase OafA/YrhL [Paraburkholderia sp. BL8N3]
MQRKNYLDAVRAFAALLVVTVHTQQTFHAPSRVIEILAAMGQLGVQLFFVLSAYLIFDSLDRIEKNGGTLGEFFVHRFLRIAPLYYFALFMGLLVFGLIFPALNWSKHAPVGYTPANILANLVFIHGIVPAANNSVVGGGWSIGAEMLFYLMAPVMFAWRRTPLRLVALGALCFPIVYAAIGVVQPMIGAPDYVDDNGFLYFSILNQLPVFVCGTLLFVWRDRLFKLNALVSAIGWLAPLGAAYYIWVWHFTDKLTFSFVPALAGVSSVFFIVLMSMAKNVGTLLSECGKRAFSMYLLNLPSILIVAAIGRKLDLHIPFFAAVPLVALLAYLIAGVTYRFIERPFIELAKRLTNPARSDSLFLR